jgi:uncharacterized membrane protein HdeD (DUF308 family)
MGPQEDSMLVAVCRRWWVLLLRGICAIGLGICAIVWPGITLLSLLFVFCAFVFSEGIAEIVLGVRGEPDGTVWWMMVILGVLSVIAAIAIGIYAITQPGLTLIMLAAFIAATAIVRGVLEIAAAIALRKHIDDEWILALSGVMSIAFGALIIYRPDAGLMAVAFLIGAYMMALGALAIALSLRLRKMNCGLATVQTGKSQAAK